MELEQTKLEHCATQGAEGNAPNEPVTHGEADAGPLEDGTNDNFEKLSRAVMETHERTMSTENGAAINAEDITLTSTSLEQLPKDLRVEVVTTRTTMVHAKQ